MSKTPLHTKKRKPKKPLTPAEMGRLGGLARARNLSPERASEIGRIASAAAVKKLKAGPRA
jgi:hypothetical protein